MHRFHTRLFRSLLLLVLTAVLSVGCSGDGPSSTPSNAAPLITECIAVPPALAPSGVSRFSLVAEDEDGDAVQVTWTADAGVFNNGATGVSVAWTAPSTPADVQVIATASDGSDSTSDTLTVRVVTEPVLFVAPELLDFGETRTALSLTISNPGMGLLDWTAAAAASWLTLDTQSGAVEDLGEDVTVTADRTGLAPGLHEAEITIQSQAGNVVIPVSLTVTAPALAVVPDALDFGATATELELTIANSGTGTLDWTATDDADWLRLAPASGSVRENHALVTVTAERGGLESGDHAARITLRSSAGDTTVPVTLTIPAAAPVLNVAPVALDFGDTATELNLVISNAGAGTLTWTVTDDVNWLTHDPDDGTLTDGTAQIAVTVHRDALSPGDHSTIVRVDSNGGTRDVPATLHVAVAEPVLGLSTERLDFGTTATERVFQIFNDGGGTLEWQLTSEASWLAFTPATGSTTGENDLITVTADRTGLSVGRHTATLVVTADSDVRVLDVTLDVSDGPVVRRNLFFLHHSTGRNLIAEGHVRDHIADIDPAFEFWDHDYNEGCGSIWGLRNPDGVYLDYDYDIPGAPCGNTDPDGLYVLWTTNNAARSRILTNHQVIAFKSCYPASDITSDAMLQQYKTWYLAIRDVLDDYPEHRFLIMGFPPRHRLYTTASQAARARAFNEWLGSAEFLDGHPNLVFFDFFDRLANPDDGSATANMLRYEYERSHSSSDSHPNAAANAAVGPHFAAALTDAAGG